MITSAFTICYDKGPMPMPPFDVKALGNSIMSFISTDDKNQVRGLVFAQTEDPPPSVQHFFRMRCSHAHFAGSGPDAGLHRRADRKLGAMLCFVRSGRAAASKFRREPYLSWHAAAWRKRRFLPFTVYCLFVNYQGVLFIHKYEDFPTVPRHRTPESILTYAPSMAPSALPSECMILVRWWESFLISI